MNLILPLTTHSRFSWLEALGLQSLAYRQVEALGKWILQCRDIRGVESHSSLVPQSIEELSAKDEPFFLISHAHGLTTLPGHRSRSLWECLFPPPFSDLALLFEPSSSQRAEFHPEPWTEGLRALWNALDSLERSLSLHELNVLELRGVTHPCDLALHYHRGKRVELGVLALESKESALSGNARRFPLEALPASPSLEQLHSAATRLLALTAPSRAESSPQLSLPAF